MNELDKIDAAVAYLKERRVNENTAAPPIWRLCWRLGIFVPPPHFLGFLPLFLLTGIPFGTGMNLLVVAFQLVSEKPLDWPVVAVGVSGAFFFGTMLSAYYRWSAWRLGLPKWSAFRPDFDAPEDSW